MVDVVDNLFPRFVRDPVSGITSLMHVEATPGEFRHRCCMCFDAFPVAGLWYDEDGAPWDECIGCHAMENIPCQTWPG